MFYNAWVTPKTAYKNALDWLVLCGTNGASRAFDGMSSGTPTNIATGSAKKFSDTVPLYVNHGADQKSDFAVMEVITWDRVLSEAEMLATVDYLKWKLRAGAVLEASEHLATESQHNLDSWGVQDLNDMASKTTEVTFANGYKADLTGWTNTRQYARGFIINKGVSTAVVKGLAPAAQYLYQIYMVHERSDWQGEAYISVNHGVQGRGYGNSLSEAKFSGVAVASPRGEINFEFARIAKHCHLTSIAIAKVISTPVGLLQEAGRAPVSQATNLNPKNSLKHGRRGYRQLPLQGACCYHESVEKLWRRARGSHRTGRHLKARRAARILLAQSTSILRPYVCDCWCLFLNTLDATMGSSL